MNDAHRAFVPGSCWPLRAQSCCWEAAPFWMDNPMWVFLLVPGSTVQHLGSAASVPSLAISTHWEASLAGVPSAQLSRAHWLSVGYSYSADNQVCPFPDTENNGHVLVQRAVVCCRNPWSQLLARYKFFGNCREEWSQGKLSPLSGVSVCYWD